MVDIQLFKPFDFDGSKIAATLTETNSKYAASTDPNASLLLSNRWSTSAGEMGALVDFSYSDQYYANNQISLGSPQVLTQGDGTSATPGTPIRTSSGDLIAVNSGNGAFYNLGDRQRSSFNYALQWAPNEHLELYAKGIYAFLSERFNAVYVSTGANYQNNTPQAYTVGNHCYPNQSTQAGDAYVGQTICDATSVTWSGNNYFLTSSQVQPPNGHDIQNSIGAKWHDGDLKLTTDVSQTLSSYANSRFIIDQFLQGPLTDTNSSNMSWSLVGSPQATKNNYYLNGLFQDWMDQRLISNAWHGDGEWRFQFGPLAKLQFGLKYAQTTAGFDGSTQISTAPPGGAGTGNIVQTPNPANQVNPLFPNYLCALPVLPNGDPAMYYTGCTGYMLANESALRNYYGLSGGPPPENIARYFNIDEKTTSTYLQLGYATEWFGIPVSGLAGVHAEQMQRNLAGYSYDVSTNISTPNDGASSDTYFLPNFSAIFQLTDTFLASFVAAKTIGYPSFFDLNPGLSINPPTINRGGTATGGNPYLTPIKSDNLDLSLEWYFSDVGSLTGGLFRHEIDGYIQTYSSLQTMNNVQYTFTVPQSSGSGVLKGVEAAYQQTFDFLPGIWSGLGTQLNYTYINASTESPAYIGGPMVKSPLVNVSNNSYNAVLFYEKYGISARLAYGYRGPYVNSINTPWTVGQYEYTVPANNLDFSIAYDVNAHATVVVQATNLLGENYRNYFGSPSSHPASITYQDRSVGLGLRLKF